MVSTAVTGTSNTPGSTSVIPITNDLGLAFGNCDEIRQLFRAISYLAAAPGMTR